MGEAYKLHVEYERLLAQRGEVEEIGLQLGEKVKEEGKPGGEDGRVLYQLAADGDAAVAGAKNDLRQLAKYKRLLEAMGVQSPGFKKWFGDWEAPNNAIAFENVDVKTYSSNELFPNTDVGLLKEHARASYERLTKLTATNLRDGTTISFPQNYLGKTIGGSDTFGYKWRIIEDLPELFENSIRLFSDIGRPEKNSIDLVSRYSSKISIDGEVIDITITIQEESGIDGKKFYYDYFVPNPEIKNSDVSALPYKGGDTVESTFTITRWLSEVNDHSVVVDQSGAPLVVFGVNFADGSTIRDLNPTGGVNVAYDPKSRLNLDLTEKMTIEFYTTANQVCTTYTL